MKYTVWTSKETTTLFLKIWENTYALQVPEANTQTQLAYDLKKSGGVIGDQLAILLKANLLLKERAGQRVVYRPNFEPTSTNDDGLVCFFADEIFRIIDVCAFDFLDDESDVNFFESKKGKALMLQRIKNILHNSKQVMAGYFLGVLHDADYKDTFIDYLDNFIFLIHSLTPSAFNGVEAKALYGLACLYVDVYYDTELDMMFIGYPHNEFGMKMLQNLTKSEKNIVVEKKI